MNVNIPPHPTPPTPRVRSINCCRKFTWTLTSHPTPPPNRIQVYAVPEAWTSLYIHTYDYICVYVDTGAAAVPTFELCGRSRGREISSDSCQWLDNLHDFYRNIWQKCLSTTRFPRYLVWEEWHDEMTLNEMEWHYMTWNEMIWVTVMDGWMDGWMDG